MILPMNRSAMLKTPLAWIFLFGAELGLAAPAVTGAGHSIGVDGSKVFEMMIALVVVIAIIIGCTHLLKRFALTGTVSQQSNMRVLGVLPLGSKERLILVKVGDQQVLLGVSPAGIQSLKTLEQSVVLPEIVENKKFTDEIKLWLNKTRQTEGESNI